MKILLVNPPARTKGRETIVVPPLGLAYLAAVARQAGHETGILDAFGEGLSWREFEARLNSGSYDIIALSAMTPVFDTVKRAMSLCRPRAKWLVLGGPHASAFAATILDDNPELDFAAFGEGEQTFLELLNALEATGSAGRTIPGLITRSGVGPERPFIADLDDLPFPARDLLPNHKYRYPFFGRRRVTTMFTSRGCPYGCTFCDKSIFGRRYRTRSAQSVLAEVDEAVGRYGIQAIIFYDDLFTLNEKRLTAICQGLIERSYALVWKAEGRVDLVKPEILKLMRRAGCHSLAFGVESAHQKSLDYLGKKTNPRQVKEAFNAAREAGIKTMAYLILGIPGESYAEAQETIRFAKEIKADYAQFSILSPLPGTKLYNEAQDRGWYAETAAHNVSDKDLLRPVVLSPGWTERELIAIVREAHRRFYLNPGYIIKQLRRSSSPGELVNLCALGLDMVRYVLTGKA